MKLNLGCGAFPLGGYVNIDSQPEYGDEHHDILKLPYEDNSIDEIYAGHVLEHINYLRYKGALTEWKRVLKPNAQLIIVVPDMSRAVDMYRSGQLSWDSLNGIIFGNAELTAYEASHKLFVSDMIVFHWLNGIFGNAEIIKERLPQMVAAPEWQSCIVATKRPI